MAMKKVLIYSHDTVGLGNMRRTLLIAEALIQQQQDVNVLIVSGSAMLHAFRISQRIDYVKLPCLDRSYADGYRARTLDMTLEDILRLRANIILNTLLEFDPDLILVDKKPLGVNRELAPAFELLGVRGRVPKRVLLLRDILDAPEQTGRVWKEQHYFEAIDAFYDQILVLGSQSLFDLPSEYGFPESAARKVKFCGYLRRANAELATPAVNRHRPMRRPPRVLLTAGGGSDGAALVHCFLTGLQNGARLTNYESLVVCGPEMDAEQQREFCSLAAGIAGCEFSDFSHDMVAEIRNADLVVCMGGYNTICEVQSLATPSIVVPRCRPVREQLMRAERMASAGLLTMIHPDNLSTTTLQQQISARLQDLDSASRVPRSSASIDLSGLATASTALLDLLNSENTSQQQSYFRLPSMEPA